MTQLKWTSPVTWYFIYKANLFNKSKSNNNVSPPYEKFLDSLSSTLLISVLVFSKQILKMTLILEQCGHNYSVIRFKSV